MALVSYILGDCPGCGAKNSYGNVHISGAHVLLGCGVCTYKAKRHLPPIKKKILYLDQYFFSHAVRGKERPFTEAAELIQELVHLQLIAVPYSDIHEDETHQWAGHQRLLEFIKDTSGGHEFLHTYEVEFSQLNSAFKAFLGGGPAAYTPKRDDAIHDDLDLWDDYVRIDVRGYHRDVELIRSLKERSVADLVGQFPGWRESGKTFEQELALEFDNAAEGYVDAYVTYAKRIADGDYMALMDAPIMSQVIEELMQHFPARVPPGDRFQTIKEFLYSDHFRKAPYQDIQARMYATLRAMVRGGSYVDPEKSVERLSGVFFDIKHISTYAPYCDAFLIDNPMAEIVGRKTVALTDRYGVRIFCRNNWGDFVDWLKGLKAGMTKEHKDALRIAYPRIVLPDDT
jgi:hypothetical protein